MSYDAKLKAALLNLANQARTTVSESFYKHVPPTRDQAMKNISHNSKGTYQIHTCILINQFIRNYTMTC